MNTDIWDNIYLSGHTMWYPSEVLVRIIRQLKAKDGFEGVVLDYGCGSGNGAEFLVRCGHTVKCAEVSPTALKTVENRFKFNRLPAQKTILLRHDAPLPEQLGSYDHVLAWDSLNYDNVERCRHVIAQLISGLPSGGKFIVSIPTPNDVRAVASELLPNGDRVIIDNIVTSILDH